MQKIAVGILFSIFLILIIDPIVMLLIDKSVPSGVQISREQYNTYLWLKNHTPDPQGKIISKEFDYTKGYYPIPTDPTTRYNYPPSAYAIMSWWGIGHQITYVAERIPNTNPFQMGIIEKDQVHGAAPFFTTVDEDRAIENLNFMGSRYVLIDDKTAANIEGIGVWINAQAGWVKPIDSGVKLPNKTKLQVPVDSNKFKKTMLNRLYYNDGNGLQHFRLIHESDGQYSVRYRLASLHPKLHAGFAAINFDNYRTADNARKFHNGFVWNKQKQSLAYDFRPPTKNYKVFEKVKGAIIIGQVAQTVPQDALAQITLNLKTKYNRTFTYQQTTPIINGSFRLVVPYPTTKMKGKDYSYDITPQGKYKLRIGDKIIEVNVSEEAVMLGNKIVLMST